LNRFVVLALCLMAASPPSHSGIVRVESDDRGRMLGYLLDVPPDPGLPRPATPYKLVVSGNGHASRLAALEGKPVVVFGAVGERGDGYYLFVDDFTEKKPK
jgi:hypothetical protein